jgi:ABC-type antimicrobial peptide transport system permease subunit
MSDLMAKTLATQRVEVALLTTMAALALVLSAVGIFALVANLVAQRTREIGIRMALGATVGQVIRHIAGPGLRASAAGCGVGILLCSGSLRLMRTAVYGVGVYDWQSLVAVVATLALVTAAATALPALRAARIDPAITLRAE